MDNESILTTVRQMVGPSASYEVFDTDLIVNINTAFSRLSQLGVGPRPPFKITGVAQTWSDFTNSCNVEEPQMLAEVKQYIYLSTKMIFDPPASATVANAYQAQIDKLEWLFKEVVWFGY